MSPKPAQTAGVPARSGPAGRGPRRELQTEHEREAGALQQAGAGGEAERRPRPRPPGEEEAEGGSLPHAAHHRGGGQPGEVTRRASPFEVSGAPLDERLIRAAPGGPRAAPRLLSVPSAG